MAATGISWVVQSKDGPYFWEPSTGKTFCAAPANAQNWHATATTGGTAFVNEQSGEEKLNLEELPKPSSSSHPIHCHPGQHTRRRAVVVKDRRG